MSTHRTAPRTLTPIVAVLLTAFLVAASAGASINSIYGEIVEERSSQTDPNVVVFHASEIGTGIDRIMHTDNDEDTASWYVDIDNSGGVTAADLRLSKRTSPSYSAGTKVQGDDDDIGLDLSTANRQICYIPTFTDVDGEEYRGADRLNPPNPASDFDPDGEPVYLVINGGGCSGQPLSDGESPVHLTNGPNSNPSLGGGSAGDAVTASDQLTNNEMVSLPTHHTALRLRFVDIDLSDGVSIPDAVYLSLENEDRPRAGDIRLFTTSTFNTGSGTGFGSYVQIDHLDSEKVLTDLGTAALRLGQTTEPSACDGTTLKRTLYLSIDGSLVVKPGDIRLAVSGTGADGSVVRPDDDDEGDTIEATGGSLRFRDNTNSDDFQYGDILYLHLDSTNVVEPGDIRLSEGGPSGVATCVSSSASDRNTPTESAGGDFGFLNAWNSATYEQGNPVYYAAGSHVGIGDVRWFNHLNTFGSHGTWVKDDGRDRWFATADFDVGTNRVLCFSPSDGTNYRLEDPVYLVINNNVDCDDRTLRVGDVRLTGTGTEAAGTTVRSGDHDFNHPLEKLTDAKVMFAGSSTYGTDDLIYLKVGTSTSVAVGDIRVTGGSGFTAGTKVTSDGSDRGDSLKDLEPDAFTLDRFKFIKQLPPSGTSFSESYSPHDVVVYDTNNNNVIDIGDIFLVGSGGSSALPGVSSGGSGGSGGGGGGGGGGGSDPDPTDTATEDPTDTTTDDPTDTTTEDPTDNATDDPDDTGDAEEEDTPFIGMVAVLAVLGAVLVALRRRQ